MCDNAPSYVPKQKPSAKNGWQKVSDKTGRGFSKGPKQQPGNVANENTNQQLPRPSFQSITKQNMPDLDHGNRFFDDNRYLAEKYGSGYITVERKQTEEQPVAEVVVEAPKPVQKREIKHVEPEKIPQKQYPPTKEDEKLARRRELYREHDPTLQHTSHVVTALMDLPSEKERYTTVYR